MTVVRGCVYLRIQRVPQLKRMNCILRVDGCSLILFVPGYFIWPVSQAEQLHSLSLGPHTTRALICFKLSRAPGWETTFPLFGFLCDKITVILQQTWIRDFSYQRLCFPSSLVVDCFNRKLQARFLWNVVEVCSIIQALYNPNQWADTQMMSHCC